MPRIHVTDVNNDKKELEFEEGYTLMEVLRDADYEDIQAMCGGCCSCATCHVHIAPEQMEGLGFVEEDEKMMIEHEDDYKVAQSRLSCQIELTGEHDGLQVTIVPSS